jgi:predicted RNase H-like nuclease (RuvC/YqgF family)
MVKRLRSVVTDLQKDLQERDRQIASLRKRLRRRQLKVDVQVKKDAEIAKRDAMIATVRVRLREEEKHTRSLRTRLEKMKEVRRVEQRGNVVPVKILPTLTRDGVKALSSEVGIRDGDVLYVPRTDGWGRSAVKELAELGAQALIAGGAATWEMDPQLLAAFAEAALPLLPEGLVRVQVHGSAGIAPEEQFQRAIREWVERQRKREREQKTALIDNIFREYRSEREKEVRRSG